MGTVALDGQDLTKASNKELSRLRRDKIGFVFQDYSLLDTMTLQDNIALPLSLSGSPGRLCLQKVQTLAAAFGLTEHLGKYPTSSPAAEAARRCLPRPDRRPEIIFADEPTGALDSKSSRDLASLPQSGK